MSEEWECWEYKKVGKAGNRLTEEKMNQLGLKGWELVSAFTLNKDNSGLAGIFKRKKTS